MDYRDAVKELESRGIMPERAPSLLPMKLALQRLQAYSFIDPNRVILVAGTNGKGSTSAALEALLLDAGQSVGLYTSPHLVETTERFRLNGRDASETDFCSAYLQVLSKTRDLKLSHFEMLTLMAVWLFFIHQTLDWVILEVGLGGVWDATNAIPHHFCLVTTIHFDHQKLLGRTLKSIALNKWGIIPRNGTVLHFPMDPSLIDLCSYIQASTQSQWVSAPAFPLRIVKGQQPRFFLESPWGEVEISLAGKRGAQNTSLALKAFQFLGFEPTPHLHALNEMKWPGRMEKLDLPFSPCPVYVSGDHNEEGVKSLISLLQNYERKTLYFLVAIASDKDSGQILHLLQSVPDCQITLTSGAYRSRPLEDYPSDFKKVASPLEGLRHITDLASQDDLIVITGSLYLVGECKRLTAQLTLRGPSLVIE